MKKFLLGIFLIVSSLVSCAPQSDEEKAFTTPKENDVVTSMEQHLSFICDVACANKYNDPNGMLNAPESYYSHIFFSVYVNELKSFYDFSGTTNHGEDLYINGTSGGGSIEIYKTRKDAEKRNNYLANFDDMGVLSSGSHKLIGTSIIRISPYASYALQEEWTNAIISSVTYDYQHSQIEDSKKTELIAFCVGRAKEKQEKGSYTTPKRLINLLSYEFDISIQLASSIVQDSGIDWKYHAMSYSNSRINGMFKAYCVNDEYANELVDEKELEQELKDEGFNGGVISYVQKQIYWVEVYTDYVEFLNECYGYLGRYWLFKILDEHIGYLYNDTYLYNIVIYSNINFTEVAVKMAEYLLEHYCEANGYDLKTFKINYDFKEYLIEEMQGNGFTDDEIDYAVSKLEAKYN